MCGGRAVFTMKEGKTASDLTVTAAFKSKGLKFESLAKETRSKSAIAYRFPTKGLG